MHSVSSSLLMELFSVLSNTTATVSDFLLLVCDRYPSMVLKLAAFASVFSS